MEEKSQDYCVLCKDGGLLRVCDYKKCLKPYHHDCVGKDESFLNDDTRWTCGLHFCYTCGKSSTFQCICCPAAYCRACFGSSKFVLVKKSTTGVCYYCLKTIKMIEEDVHVDSEGDEVDFDKRDTSEFLFKDYWRLIKEEEKLTLVDIQTAIEKFQRIKDSQSNSNCDGIVSEEPMSGSDVSDLQDDSEGEKSNKRSREKLYENRIQKTPKKGRAFVGWASAELIKFLTSVGKSTTEPLGQQEVTDIIKAYVQSNSLFPLMKKKKNHVILDEKLRTLFRKKKLKYHKIYDLVKKHLAYEQSDDDFILSSDHDDVIIPAKKQRNVQSENNIKESSLNSCSKKIVKQPRSCYAALVADNIKLIYLKRSLIVELLKTPESFDAKAVGCFVRIKKDPKDFMYLMPKRFQIGQILGVKESEVFYKVGERSTNVVLRVSNVVKDVKLSTLSEDDIDEEEIADLQQLVKIGLFKQPTIAEIESKIKIIHEAKTNHWIDKEIVRLQNLIDRANEKGWRKELHEYIDKRELLRKPEERLRRLKEIPNVIPDEERVDEPIYLNGVNTEMETDTKFSVQTERSTEIKIVVNQQVEADSEANKAWYYTDPSGKEQGPFTLSELRKWKNEIYFADDFKIWKSGQCKEDSVLLIDALASVSPQ